MTNEERRNKFNEIKLELIKARVNAAKNGSSKTREAKKIIARMFTLDKSDKNDLSKT
ncbi:50S ribosomal protein L29 [Candidatus Pacearchaeota archaeon]|nr:50S ribosomal protein L29 [Candidatus Pacearchaeota archaeon]